MKKANLLTPIFALTTACGVAPLTFTTSCSNKVTYPDLVGTPKDYSKGEYWMIKQDKGDQKVDLFYLYPTCNNQTTEIAEIDHYMKSTAYDNYEWGPSCMDAFTNVFAPYYRQVTITTLAKDPKKCNEAVYNSVVRTDVYAALDYYFEHYNNGRPVIFASHSQGSSAMQIVLAEYMKLHPDYYNRMICAYTIGMNYSKAYAQSYPHVKFATGETDLGVVIGWNTEIPRTDTKDQDYSFVVGEPGTTVGCINPLNWKTTEEECDISLNKGTYDKENHTRKDGVTGTKIDKNRNVLVVTKENITDKYKPLPAIPKLFNNYCMHPYDWEFFYTNIQENAQKRIDAWFKSH